MIKQKEIREFTENLDTYWQLIIFHWSFSTNYTREKFKVRKYKVLLFLNKYEISKIDKGVAVKSMYLYLDETKLQDLY